MHCKLFQLLQQLFVVCGICCDCLILGFLTRVKLVDLLTLAGVGQLIHQLEQDVRIALQDIKRYFIVLLCRHLATLESTL